MLLTEQSLQKHVDQLDASLELEVGKANNAFDYASMLDSPIFEDFDDFEDIQGEQWLRQLEDYWQCVASDSSVHYKLMSDHYRSLHANNLAIDLKRLKSIGKYKVLEITRCSYEIRKNKFIRVTGNAKLVFGLKD